VNKYLSVLPEVREALRLGMPIVALESTIIAHGMPYPINVETAREVEDAVRKQGAVPATIAVMDGRVCVGLASQDLTTIGRAEHVLKVSRRDLPIAIASKKIGATTVSATMFCAKIAGISVFATGGIGGVHRHGETTLDLSADIMELARTSVAVVCAGAKAILDIPRTLEVLETHGVPIVGFETDTFPAFYTRSSGLPVDIRLNDPNDIARLMSAKWGLGLEGGILITTPVPEHSAMDTTQIATIIEQAVAEAEQAGIRGKEVTPFLLRRVCEQTGGQSLEANRALVKNNAEVAATIAVAYAARQKQS
jgi:pseudouridine-5'-phosphate glycosidase